MVPQHHQFTDTEFDHFVTLPENRDRNFEYIAGEFVEILSNGKTSRTAVGLLSYVGIYVDDYKLGRCTGADGGYSVFSEKYVPKGAFVSYQRQPVAPDIAYNPVAPDLVIEVVSPENDAIWLTRKIGNYLAAGTVVWVADPSTKSIDVYTPNQPRKTLHVGDVIEGGEVLPGFRLAIANVFSD